MRRQTADTCEVSEGAVRSFRLDPFHLPARVEYFGAVRAGARRHSAVIGPDSIVIRRMTGAGVPLYVTVPVRCYRGVLLTAADGGDERVALRLVHANDELAVPLFEADDADDVLADWQAWGRALARPLLIEDADGVLCEPHDRLGSLIVKRPKARRVNKFFAERRPRFLCRRAVGGKWTGAVHHEPEIIARGTVD